MGDPELHSDEKIILTTQNVFVKSIPFEAILTTKRIILIDRKKNLIPPKDILLATVREVEGGENAIRDQIITLSLITTTGETRQLVLTFSRTAGGGRKRERAEWLKALKDQTSPSIQQAIRKVVPTFEEEKAPRQKEPATPKLEITSRPAAKKEIEIAQPMKKIVETGSVLQKPVETPTMPAGSSFCNRCGNRLSPESAFCNRCGTKVPGPDAESPAGKPVVPQVSVDSPMPPAAVSAAERKESPVEMEIRSIEPLIDGSVPRTTEAPLIEPARSPEKTAERPAEKAAEPPAPEESSIAKAAQSIIDAAKAAQPEGTVPAPVPAQAPEPQPAVVPEQQHRNRSVFPAIFPKKDQLKPVPSGGSGSGRRRAVIMVAAAVVVILLLAGGAFIYWNFLKGTGSEGDGTASTTSVPTTLPTTVATPTPAHTTATPVATTVATPEPTPVVLIPETGVWVRVIYPGTFKGTVGTAAGPQEVRDTGDKFYSIPTSEGIVSAAVQKTDGSGDELLVEVYKNGNLVKSASTTVPKGIVELVVDLKPPKTTAIPTTAATTADTGASANATANATATSTL